jgi:WD40 repeat protein
VILDEPAGVNLSAFAFHAGGRKFAVAHAAGDVSVYAVDAGRLRPLAVGTVRAIAFHPSDDRLAIACGKVLQIFDSNTGAESKRLRPESTDDIACIAWHPDGRRVAVGCGSRMHVFDADSAVEILPAWESRADLFEIAFNHAGDRLLSRDRSMQTVLWDVASREPLLPTPQELSPHLTFSPDDRSVGVSRLKRGGGKVQVWRVAGGNELRVLDDPADRTEMFMGGAMDSSRIFATGSVGGTLVSFFDTGSGEKLATVSVSAHANRPFAFDPMTGGWITGGTRGVMLWPLRSEPGRPASLRVGPPQPILSGPGDALWGYSAASRNGRALAISDVNSGFIVDRDGGPRRTLGPHPGLWDCAISPDGKWIATFSGGPEGPPVRLWDGRYGHRVEGLPLNGSRWWAVFSPDGRWLATHDDSESQVWRIGSWKEPVRSLAGAVVFSPDGKILAVNDVIGCVRLVKTESGDEVARVTGPERSAYWPQCFTPDGTKLIAMGDGLCMWDLRLIRTQLQAMGFDWDWPPFPPAVPDTRGRLHLTVDTGIVPQGETGATSPRPPE